MNEAIDTIAKALSHSQILIEQISQDHAVLEMIQNAFGSLILLNKLALIEQEQLENRIRYDHAVDAREGNAEYLDTSKVYASYKSGLFPLDGKTSVNLEATFTGLEVDDVNTVMGATQRFLLCEILRFKNNEIIGGMAIDRVML